MRAWLIPFAVAYLTAGCTTRQVDPSRPISRDLPLSYIDLAEIKIGATQHQEVLKERKFYHQPELEQYVTSIGYRLAAVSERPHLPYQFFILDDEHVDAFSLGGGYIYVTKGLLKFVESEAELAAVLAHEIAHISAGVHTPSIDHPITKKELFMKALSTGAGIAAGAAGGFVGGSAGKIASKSVDKVVGEVVPQIRKRFQKPDEMIADQRAVIHLQKANYDPRELVKFLDKLSHIKITDIEQYIEFLNSHPPYQERRELLEEMMREINFNKSAFELRNERFASIRTMTMELDKVKPTGSSVLVQTSPVDGAPVS